MAVRYYDDETGMVDYIEESEIFDSPAVADVGEQTSVGQDEEYYECLDAEGKENDKNTPEEKESDENTPEEREDFVEKIQPELEIENEELPEEGGDESQPTSDDAEKMDTNTGEESQKHSEFDEEVKKTMEILLEGITGLHEKFDTKIKQSESQDTMTKALYAELQEHKKGLYSSVMKPLLLEIMQLRNNILSQGNALLEKEGEEAVISVRTFLSYAEDIAYILELYGVDNIRSQEGDMFNPKVQKALKRVETSDEGLHKRIAKSVSEGYLYNGQAALKENVMVYTYVPEEEIQQEKN